MHLITGATRGIGLALTTHLRNRDAPVIATARDPSNADHLRALGARVEQLDVADPASIEALAARLEGTPIDVLINNAGLQHDDMRLADVDPDTMLDLYRVNTLAPILLTRALLPNLRAGSRHLVVNISTNLASLHLNGPEQPGGWYAYRASKAALNMLTRNLAHDLPDLTAVALHPGWVRTDMGGPDAPLSVDESAAAILDTVDRLTPADSGRFMNNKGETMPW